MTLPAPTVYSDHINVTVPPTNYYTCVVLTPAITTGTAKTIADNGAVLLNSEIVSAVYSGFFYVEDANRTKGMRVTWTGSPVQAGDAVSIAGHDEHDSRW